VHLLSLFTWVCIICGDEDTAAADNVCAWERRSHELPSYILALCSLTRTVCLRQSTVQSDGVRKARVDTIVHRGVVYLSPADNSNGSLLSCRRGAHQPVVQASPHVCRPSFTPSCPFIDRPIPLLCTIIFLANRLPHLRLRPRRYPVEQDLFERPHVIGQARGHRRCTRPPHLRCATAVGKLRYQQGLA
jgi:hypothetical protein